MNIHQGRKAISQSLRLKGFPMGEQEVRSRLHTLQYYGFVLVRTGRNGTELTPLGEMAYRSIST